MKIRKTYYHITGKGVWLPQWYSSPINFKGGMDEHGWVRNGDTHTGPTGGDEIINRPLNVSVNNIKRVGTLESDAIGTITYGFGDRVYVAEYNSYALSRNIKFIEVSYISYN